MLRNKKRKKIYSEFIVPTIISTTISILGFLIYNFYFLPINVKNEVKRDMYIQLLSETSLIYDHVNSTNTAIISDFSSYGLQSKDLDTMMNKYYINIKKVESLDSKLRSMGNEEQISFNKVFLEELWIPYRLMYDHKSIVKSFEQEIRLNKRIVNQRDIHINKNFNELDSIINMENRLYFELRDHYFPRLTDLARLNNYYYRKELGLNITSDIVEAKKNIIRLDSLKKIFKPFNHRLPFSIAKGRHLIDYQVDSGDSIVNQLVKSRIMNKFLTQSDSN